jgi:hypothetical protein
MINLKTIVRLAPMIGVAVALILLLPVLGPWNLSLTIAEPLQAEHEANATSDNTAGFTVHNATTDDLVRLSEAAMAFAAADLELPGLDIWFHTDREPCSGHHGLFRATSESWQIRICSSDLEFVYEHELAHAWIAANVEERQRSAFVKLRGLEHWADRSVPWNERGTEWAAVVVQQGLSGLPLPPALSDEAKLRLESYELLTGRVAPVLVEWIASRDVPCSDRPTNLSRPITDGTGRTCNSSRSVSASNRAEGI